MCMPPSVCMWHSEDNLRRLVLPSNHVDPGQQLRSSGLTVSASALRAILLALRKYFYGVSLLLILVTAMLEVSFYFKKCPIV